MAVTRIAIIGGGPGGLMTAHALQSRAKAAGRSCEITLFESSQRLGGKIRTGTFTATSVPYEAGAAELYDYSQAGEDPLRSMIREFGLTTRPMRGRTVFIGDLMLKTDQDIRRELGPETDAALKEFTRRAIALISPAEYYESDWKEDNQDPLARQTFAEFLESVPDEAARNYIRVAVHSDLATEPHQTSAMYGLQNYLMNEPGYMQLYTIDGGIERLMHELVERIEATVKLGHRVCSVGKMAAGRYLVTARRHVEVISGEFDFVVACLPNGWLPAIDWQGEKLARAMHLHHKHYDHPAHYLRVSVLFQKPFWLEHISDSYFMIDAFGGCCVYDETSRCDGSLFGVLGWLIGGESALILSNLDDSELIHAVLDALPGCLRHGRELVVEGRVHRWVGAVNGLPGGFPMREPDSRHLPEPEEHPELFVVGDYLFDSTINGVLDSADTVAEWIVEDME
jgi:protoporphyrinogen oxidase